MATTCFVCCEESLYWTLPPCNHTHICWKCCLKLVDGSIFSCPFCKDKPDAKSQLLFVTTQQMEAQDFQSIMQQGPYRSNKNTYYFYSDHTVAEYIEAEISFHCVLCGQVHETMNLLKKHLYGAHRAQFCDVCLENRKCMIAEQRLYTDHELQLHLKEGEASNTGEISLYHPHCEFCARRFYDLQSFKLHLRLSAHLKCEICDLNCPKLKFVYYKNFEQLQRHHRKSHFVCDVGECITRKLQNVFASQALLEEHKRRLHRKYRGDKQEKVDNIILGFNKKEEDDFIDFDGIGKDMAKEFTVFELQGPVQKETHSDDCIDLREFYLEIVKANHNPRVEDIKAKVEEMHDREGLKNREPNFAHLPLYKPLEMSPLAKYECEKVLRKVYPQREAESIIELFFTKKNEYATVKEYIQAIEKRMRTYSAYAFFLVFPQLIRNLKPENRNKQLMDEHYAACLRRLPVNRLFIFHEFERYSALIEITKSTVEEEVGCRLGEGEIDLEIYAKFLREMNANYYVQRHEQIYWVSKQKMTHLYHMIERCKTKDFLKMNWLLKVGLSTPSYNLLAKFYYSTRKDIEQAKRLLQPLSLQELSLLNAYLEICLQSLLDLHSFEEAKRNPKPHYLTGVVQMLPQNKRLPQRQLEELRKLEGHSHAIVKQNNERRIKGIYINQADCPSLLAPIKINEVVTKPKVQKPEIMLGKGTLPTPWNEERANLKKKAPQQKIKNEQQFPTLAGSNQPKTSLQPATSLHSATKKQAKNELPQKQQEFPVFNFNQKYVNPKHTKNPQSGVGANSWVNFNNKEVNRSYWDEDRTRKKWKETELERETIAKNAEMRNAEMRNTEIRNAEMRNSEVRNVETKGANLQQSAVKKKYKKQVAKGEEEENEEDRYLRLAIEESLHTAKEEDLRRRDSGTILQKKQEETVIVPRKNNKIEEEEPVKPKRKKKVNEKVQKQAVNELVQPKESKQQLSLFERIELEENQAKNKRSPFRRDISYEKPPKTQLERSLNSITQPRDNPKLSSLAGPFFDDDDFQPLGQSTGGTTQESIVTRLMKESKANEESEVRAPRQKYKKKKHRGEDDD